MPKQLCRFFLLCLAGASIALAAYAAGPREEQEAEIKRLRKELSRVELELDQVRRFIPITFDPEAEEGFFRKASEDLKLPLKIKTLPGSDSVPFPDGKPSPILLYRLEIFGRGDLDDVHELLRRIGIRSWRAGALETLDLEMQDDGAIRFVSRFVLPAFNIVDEPMPSSPSLPRDLVASYRERLARSQALLDLIGTLVARFESSQRGDALAVLDATRDLPSVKLTDASLGDQILIRGVLSGKTSREGLLTNLEKGGYSVTRFQTSPSGLCRPFSIEVQRGTGKRAEVVLDEKLNDKRAARFCGTEPKRSAGRVVAKGANKSGPLTMHLRDVDLPGVFYVLHDLTSENFIVDQDVRGQVDVDVEQATLGETLAAMKTAGVTVGPGPLRRVSLAGKPNASKAADEKYTGEPINLVLQDMSVPDVLCLFSNVTGATFLIPDEVHGQTTIYVHDLPWDEVLAGLFLSAGVEYTIDKDSRIYVGSQAAIKAKRPGTNVCEVASATPSPTLAGALLKLSDLAVADIELAGVARSGESWKGYTRISGNRLTPLLPDYQLIDARVKSVGAASVVFTTDSSPVEVRLQP